MRWILVSTIIFLILSSYAYAVEVESLVNAKLNSNEEVDVIVILKETQNMQQQNPDKFQSKEAKLSALEQRKNSIKSNQQKVLKNLNNNNFKPKHKYSTINAFSGTVTRKGLEELKSNPDVEKILFDKTLTGELSTSVPLIRADDVQIRVINGRNITGYGETVCVVDSGINYSHPDLGGCFGADCKVLGGWDFVNNDNDPMDFQSHGTHCAGIVAANGGVIGVAPEANLIAIKSMDDSQPYGQGSDSGIAAGIDWCVNNASAFNISVISLSLGDGGEYASGACPTGSYVMEFSIAAANSAGITVVAASGNDYHSNGISYPACSPNTISVGASTKSDSMESYTNTGDLLDILAPGQSIESTSYTGSGTATKSGTSMACPHVAGVAALMIQDRRESSLSTLTPQEIIAIMKNTTLINISDSGLTFPRVDAYRAIMPIIDFKNPTPINDAIISPHYAIFNISVSHKTVTSAYLEIDNQNYSMNGGEANFFLNKSVVGNKTYKFWANDSYGYWIDSSERIINTLNNAPNITDYSPINLSLEVYENSSLQFDHNSSDLDEDFLSYSWILDTIEQSTNKSWSYEPNFNSSGEHNITLTVTDTADLVQLSWDLTVINLNRVPTWTQTPESRTILEDSTLVYDINATDPDSEQVFYYVNDTNFTINLTSGLLQFTPYSDWYGNLSILLTAGDGTDNISATINVNVTSVNDAPVLSEISNITALHSTNITINASASDIDTSSLTHSINDTRFSQNNNLFWWLTNETEIRNYWVNISVTDSILGDWQLVYITVSSDNDGDGIIDSDDNLLGNLSDITTNITDLSLEINETTNLSEQFNNTLNITFKANTSVIIYAQHNFSTNAIILADIEVQKSNSSDSAGYTLIKGLSLASGETKTIYVDNLTNTSNGVCIKDTEVNSISDISAACSSADETKLTCPGTSGAYTCTLGDNIYIISGLSNSAVREQCIESWSCGDWSSCDGSTQTRTCTDANNCGTTYDRPALSQSCTLGTTSTSGSSSSSSGGASYSTVSGNVTQGLSETRYFAVVEAGVPNNMRIESENIPLQKISFTTNKPINLIKMYIKVREESEIKVPSLENVYKYIEFIPEGITDSDISSSAIESKVSKTWINGYDKDTVTLQRYNNEQWNRLNTILIDEDDDFYYYSSETPGFSMFALTAELSRQQPQEIINAPEEPTLTTESLEQIPEKTQEQETTIEEEIPNKSYINYILLIIILVITISWIIYYFKISKKDKKKKQEKFLLFKKLPNKKEK
ncbi:S8 family serine peptidase [Candidatus Woesearchaeota archaeon]|nr:S8 family serine peptidase [Candidatus Woesearchaeota archaeon]